MSYIQFYQLNKNDKNYLLNIKKLYNKLEFANILSGYRYITSDKILSNIRNNGIILELLKEVHNIVTSNIDEIFESKGISNFIHIILE